MAHTHVRISGQLVERDSDGVGLVLWSVESPSGRVISMGVSEPRATGPVFCEDCDRAIAPAEPCTNLGDAWWCSRCR